GEILNESYSFNGLKHALHYGPRRYATIEPVLRALDLLQKPVSAETKTELRQLLAREAMDRLVSEPTIDPGSEASDGDSTDIDVHRRVMDELEKQVRASSPSRHD